MPRSRQSPLLSSGLSQGYESKDTWLEISLKVVSGLLKQHIISSPTDSMALVFYNTVGGQSLPVKLAHSGPEDS